MQPAREWPVSTVKAGLTCEIVRAEREASQTTRAWVDSDATRAMSASSPAAVGCAAGDFSGEAGTEDVEKEGDADGVLQS